MDERYATKDELHTKMTEQTRVLVAWILAVMLAYAGLAVGLVALGPR